MNDSQTPATAEAERSETEPTMAERTEAVQPTWWRNPWVITFTLGVLILPWFRPLFSRVAPMPPLLGVEVEAACGQSGEVRAIAVCGSPGECTTAEASALFKAWQLGRQNGLEVEWLWVGAADHKWSEGQAWSVCGSGDSVGLADRVLTAQRSMRHVLEHPAVDLRAAVILVDRRGRARGILSAAGAMGRREVVGRLIQLQSSRADESDLEPVP